MRPRPKPATAVIGHHPRSTASLFVGYRPCNEVASRAWTPATESPSGCSWPHSCSDCAMASAGITSWPSPTWRQPSHPGAAASIREGLEETLTLLRMGVTGRLLESLRSTNAIESVNDKIATYSRRVKRWRGGQMILRWVGAAVLDARRGFRAVKGHREMHLLVDALRRHEKMLHPETEAA